MASEVTLQDVARHPRPGLRVPRGFKFTPDGRRFLYLYAADNPLVQQLWLYDSASGRREQIGVGAIGDVTSPADLSLDQQLRRERGRVRELGVTHYDLAASPAGGPPVILVPLDGTVYVRHSDGPLTRLEGCDGAIDARLSVDGSHVAFIRDDELHVATTSGPPVIRQLTMGAGQGITNGTAEYIAQEEMGRSEGYWWSPNGTRIAYAQVDTRHIPPYPIPHQGKSTPSVEEHRYPFAGSPNAIVRLAIVDVADEADTTVWMDLGQDSDVYLARVAWRPDGVLTAQIQLRDQRTLRLVAFDSATGKAITLIEEHGEPWLNLSRDTRFLTSGEILWSSERSGFRHLYLYDSAGREIRQLTAGPWVVTAVVAIDEQKRLAYFEGTRDGVLERHLYTAPLDGGPIERLTQAPGWHAVTVAPDFRSLVDTYSTLVCSPVVVLRRLDGPTQEIVLHEDTSATAEALGLLPPELITFRTRDGALLHSALYVPPEAPETERRFPLIVSVYGGPHAQAVANRWDMTVDLRAQYLAQHGFIVLKVDNRGSANRGLAFEAVLARSMGATEVSDQVDGVHFIAQRPYVDANRVGIYGWSYGGYMTCMAMMREPDIFKVGVAGAPVTHWDGYDTHYTERYMGLPSANQSAYKDTTPLNRVETLRGKLLLVHGLVDENVHFRHTARLIVALTEAQKPYDLLLFPEERHMPRDPADLEYLERRLIAYFEAYL